MKDPKYRKAYEKFKQSGDYQVNKLVFEARAHAVLSQERLAKKIGTKQPAIARIENCSISPSVRTLEKIAKACKGYLEIKFIPHPKKED